ncbi:Ger(x)C family spore germination protein [Ammoniphilus sp. 3BR4]|uniref:Ger(x)C family spore germination protein n=1 Tax=Ammoniphilus sp. 3BR4 TaxID=3158265 RepID=UPI0034660993
MKRAVSLILLIVCLTLVTGCWDNTDLELRTSVVAIGVDRSKTDKGRYTMTIQVPIPNLIMGGAGGEQGQEAIRVMSATGNTLNEASSNLQKRLNQVLFYGHTRILVLSEEVAKEGIEELLDPFRRAPQIRRLMWPMVVKGSARELLLSNTKLEQIPTVYIMDLLDNGAERGLIPHVTIGHLFADLSDSSTEAGMNYVEASKEEFKWNGFAVFRQDRMAGTLKDGEVWSLLHLRENQLAGEIDVPFGGTRKKRNLVTYRPKTIRVNKDFTPKGDTGYEAEYRIRLEGDVIESQCDIDFSQEKNIEKLEKVLSEEMTNQAKKMIHKLQKEYKSDVLKLGTFVRATHPQWWTAEKWIEVFPYGKIQVTYEVHIRRTGMEIR